LRRLLPFSPIRVGSWRLLLPPRFYSSSVATVSGMLPSTACHDILVCPGEGVRPAFDTNTRRHREEFQIVSSFSASLTSVNRVFNFNAGPSALPLSVLERIREELLDWRGSGMSVMEMSHRSPEFEIINAAAEAGLRKHLAIPDD